MDHADYAEAFKAITKEHDERYNPGGVPYKPKRAAADPLGTTVESRAVSLASVEGVTKETLQTKGNLAVVLGSEPFYEILVCKDGILWLHALNDGVVSDQVALCGLGDYKYTLGEEANRLVQGTGANTWRNILSCHADCKQVSCIPFCLCPTCCRCQLVPLHSYRRPMESHILLGGHLRHLGAVPRHTADPSHLSDILGETLPGGGVHAQQHHKAGGGGRTHRGSEGVGVQGVGGAAVRAPHHPAVFILSAWSQTVVQECGCLGGLVEGEGRHARAGVREGGVPSETVIMRLADNLCHDVVIGVMGLHGGCAGRYSDKGRIMTPEGFSFWLTAPVRLVKGQIVKLV